MMKNNYQYDYTAPEDQYVNTDLHTNKIVDANYVDTYLFRRNPYIEALPLPKTGRDEIVRTYSSLPAMPSYEEFIKMPPQIKTMLIDNLDKIRFALPFYKDLEAKFYRTLTDAYSMRVEYEMHDTVELNGVSYEAETGLKANHEGESVNGFSVLGVAGTGKSTAMNRILDHFPQVIRHHLDGRTVIQLVYLYITCENNSNFSALYQQIGAKIDEALNNGNHFYENAIAKERTLGQKSLKVRSFIKKLNIGCLIFDEIQNIDLTSTSENSIEALLTINNDAHVGIGVMGTEEAFNKIFSRERIARRLSDYVGAGRYCENMDACASIVRALFDSVSFFPEKIVPGKDIIKVFWDETNGIIAYILKLFILVVKDYTFKKEKPEITAEYVQKIAVEKNKILHDLVKDKNKSYGPSELKYQKLIKEMNEYDYDQEKRQEDDEFIHADMDRIFPDKESIIQNILTVHPEYNRGTVENAVNIAMTKGNDTVMSITEAAIAHLKKGNTDRRRKQKSLLSPEEMLHNIDNGSK